MGCPSLRKAETFISTNQLSLLSTPHQPLSYQASLEPPSLPPPYHPQHPSHFISHPHIPSSRSVKPKLSRNCLDPFASQIWTFFSANSLALVDPLINQSNSSATPRKKSVLVVSSGMVPYKKVIHYWMSYLYLTYGMVPSYKNGLIPEVSISK